MSSKERISRTLGRMYMYNTLHYVNRPLGMPFCAATYVGPSPTVRDPVTCLFKAFSSTEQPM
jgi:hypothetical protein